MINLISLEQKREIRAARINVLLVRYCGMLVTLALVVGMIYGLGFWLVFQDKMAINEKLLSQSEQSRSFTIVEREAEAFRENLAIAKQILGSETSYSTFLTTLGKDMPTGAVLTNFALGSKTPSSTAGGMTIEARAVSYAKVLELKANLEQSPLFEDVKIVNTTRPDDLTGLIGLAAKYPYEASFSVKLTQKKAGSSS